MTNNARINHTGKAATGGFNNSLRPIVLGLCLALGATAASASPGSPQGNSPASPASPLRGASAEVQRVAHWVIDSRDNAGLPFVLVDKVNAEVYAFDRSGKLQGAAPALLGMAHGDRLMVPNDTKVPDVPPEARITPAGRFLSRLAIDSHDSELLVIDYAASISLHPVVKGTPEERRAERLASPTSQDNRISYGCINVPAAFYSSVVSPTFSRTAGVVYILPETESADELFGMRPAGGAAPSLSQRGSTAVSAQ